MRDENGKIYAVLTMTKELATEVSRMEEPEVLLNEIHGLPTKLTEPKTYIS